MRGTPAPSPRCSPRAIMVTHPSPRPRARRHSRDAVLSRLDKYRSPLTERAANPARTISAPRMPRCRRARAGTRGRRQRCGTIGRRQGRVRLRRAAIDRPGPRRARRRQRRGCRHRLRVSPRHGIPMLRRDRTGPRSAQPAPGVRQLGQSGLRTPLRPRATQTSSGAARCSGGQVNGRGNHRPPRLSSARTRGHPRARWNRRRPSRARLRADVARSSAPRRRHERLRSINVAPTIGIDKTPGEHREATARTAERAVAEVVSQ